MDLRFSYVIHFEATEITDCQIFTESVSPCDFMERLYLLLPFSNMPSTGTTNQTIRGKEIATQIFFGPIYCLSCCSVAVIQHLLNSIRMPKLDAWSEVDYHVKLDHQHDPDPASVYSHEKKVYSAGTRLDCITSKWNFEGPNTMVLSIWV